MLFISLQYLLPLLPLQLLGHPGQAGLHAPSLVGEEVSRELGPVLGGSVHPAEEGAALNGEHVMLTFQPALLSLPLLLQSAGHPGQAGLHALSLVEEGVSRELGPALGGTAHPVEEGEAVRRGHAMSTVQLAPGNGPGGPRGDPVRLRAGRGGVRQDVGHAWAKGNAKEMEQRHKPAGTPHARSQGANLRE